MKESELKPKYAIDYGEELFDWAINLSEAKQIIEGYLAIGINADDITLFKLEPMDIKINHKVSIKK